MLKKLKKLWNRYLEELAKENESQFGKGTLDCCKLNKNNKEKQA